MKQKPKEAGKIGTVAAAGAAIATACNQIDNCQVLSSFLVIPLIQGRGK
jgi:hypothetical protein